MSEAVGPAVGGGAVTVTLADALAALVPLAPVAVKTKVTVPALFKMNCMPDWFTGFPSRATEEPFSVNVTLVALVVVQLTVTLSPA